MTHQIDGYKGLLGKIALNMYKNTPSQFNLGSYQDYFQEACVGFLKLEKYYNEKLGTRFTTFISHCVFNHLIYCTFQKSLVKVPLYLIPKKYKDHKYKKLVNNVVFTCIKDIEGSDNSNNCYQTIELLNCYLGQLSKADRELIELRFGLKDGKPKKVKELAKKYGITHQYVCLKIKRILQRIREKNGISHQEQLN